MRFPLGRRKEGHLIQVRILPGIVWLYPRETQDFASLQADAIIVISSKHIQLFAVDIKVETQNIASHEQKTQQ